METDVPKNKGGRPRKSASQPNAPKNKGGRPKKSGDRKYRNMSVAMTDEDRRTIHSAAAATGESISGLIRRCIEEDSNRRGTIPVEKKPGTIPVVLSIPEEICSCEDTIYRWLEGRSRAIARKISQSR